MEKREIRKKCKKTAEQIGKINFKEIANYIEKKHHYNIYITQLESTTAAYTNKKEKYIAISEQVDEEYGTKLLLHELGHIELEHKNNFADDSVRKENEANYFAKYILNRKKRKYVKIITLTILISIMVILSHNLIILNGSALIEGEQVVITSGGSKYHDANCYYVKGKESIIIVTKEEAEKAGYEGCKICQNEKK